VTAPTFDARHVRVLVVDGHSPARRALCDALSSLTGVVLSCAASLASARRKLDGGEIDVLLVDPTLEDDGGRRLARDAAHAHPKVATFFLVAPGERASSSPQAILAGALGAVERPDPRTPPEEARAGIHTSLGPLLRVSVAPASTSMRDRPRASREPARVPALRELIAIGASTGGPPALATVLRALPAELRTPIVIVQHMGAEHVPNFVAQLASRTGRNVVLASHGAKLEPSRTYIARGGVHLLVERRPGGLSLIESDAPPEHNCRPAVDPLFCAVAQSCGPQAVGVIMTGMGVDGALGARAMRDAGAPIIAQDESTSVVWGMPGAAVGAGATDVVTPLDRIAGEIESWIAE
jgi:two-component system, chemotaxis family, protein-glutamate methylesterase/glutaminase